MATHHHNEEIAIQQQRWQTESVEPVLRDFPERQMDFTTPSGIALKRLYTPLDSPDADYLEQSNFPGQFPFTRGVHPSMYRGRLWTMRQYAGFGTAEVSNQRYKFLLEHGQKGLSVAFDLPTQMGYDSDHPMAAGEVGKVGVAIASLQDMERLFKDIPLDQVSTSMTINATAATLLALYIAIAKKQGVAPAQLTGTIQNDILKEYIARGTYIYPPKPSMRLITDVFAYAAKEMPRWNTISISGYHIREAGSTAVQEVAFTLADGIAYVEAALEAGLDVNEFGTQLSFFFNVHNHFLEEIAKFRAARRLWARIMRDRFQATAPRAQMLRFHAQTAGSTLTAQQPDNNVVRVALQAMAAVLGGAQSLHTNSRDEALALPTEESVQIALRTQQIIAHETGVAKSADPVGGAYAIEALTTAIEERAQAYIEQIDAMGGAVRAIECGFPQREIQHSAYQCQQEIEAHSRIVVGVNAYTLENEPTPALLRIDPDLERQQIARLQGLRAQRNNAQVKAVLHRLEQAARGSENLMPLLIEAVEYYATLGEIADTLRAVFGEHQEQIVLTET
jgi:methylmalonyl-CoA mutase N-terminal domain/subunit